MAPFNLLESHSHRYHWQYVTAWCVAHVDLLHERNGIKFIFVSSEVCFKFATLFNIYVNWNMSFLGKIKLEYILGIIVNVIGDVRAGGSLIMKSNFVIDIAGLFWITSKLYN